MNSKKSSLDLEILKRVNVDRLIKFLEDEPGPKDLIIDSAVMKMLDRITDAKLLRNHGVEKMFRLESVPPPVGSSTRFYLVRSDLTNVKFIADHVNADLMTNMALKINVIVVPRLLSWFAEMVEEEGLYGKISLHEFRPDFIPLDDNLLTLEFNSFFKDVFLESDYSSCIAVAHSIGTLQDLFGEIPNIFGHGRAAQVVVQTLQHLRSVDLSKPSKLQEPRINHFFVFDRDVDYVTPLLTQLTYEGTLDEHFGISAGVIELPPEVTGAESITKVALNSKDSVFDNIRNRHFAGVSSYLALRGKELQSKRLKAQNMSTAQIKDFVANDLRNVQVLQKSLCLHLSACEAVTKHIRRDFDVQLTTEHGLVTGSCTTSEIRNYIENAMARQLPLESVLRLLCLHSQTQEGILHRDFESFSKQFLASYGYAHLVTLNNLQSVGLLSVLDPLQVSPDKKVDTSTKHVLKHMASSILGKGGPWRTLTKKLKLIPDENLSVDLHSPNHMSYVFNGAYTSVIPKIISEVYAKKNIQAVIEALRPLSGSTINITNDSNCPTDNAALVLFLGGVTFSEIAALRLLGVMINVNFIVAATNTVTGTGLVMSAAIGS